jgi:HEAT repeat protein
LKTKTLLIVVITLWEATALPRGMNASQLNQYTQSISNSDPSVRFAGMHNIAELLERSPDKAGNEVLPLLDKGLNDADEKVRALAVGSVAIIAMETTPKLGSAKAGLPDLRSFAPLRGDLEKAMFDSDAQVRRAALGAYFFTFDVSPDLQSKLIGQFAGEEKTGLQPLIIDALMTCKAPTPATQAFLTKLLNDPKLAPFVVQSIATVPVSSTIAPPPAAALPRLADMVTSETNGSKRQLLARALGKYGAQARPYLRRIEQLQQKESDAVTRANLKAAADAIRLGKPLGED